MNGRLAETLKEFKENSLASRQWKQNGKRRRGTTGSRPCPAAILDTKKKWKINRGRKKKAAISCRRLTGYILPFIFQA